jgi:catechol 2,3-dioxygenase-like lactoylglutathione lyase family enzyme
LELSIVHIALIVRDYDEAIAFFVGKLGFRVVEDREIPEQGKRWVVVAPPSRPADGTSIVLARAARPEEEALVGRQASRGSSSS